MVREPLVDQLLHRPRSPDRAPDVAAAAFRLEVADQVLVAGVARTSLIDLGLDQGFGRLDPLGLGDLGDDQQRLDALLGRRA